MIEYFIFSALLLSIGVTGLFVNRNNLIIMLMCIELILLAVNTNFIAFSKYWGDMDGQLMVFFVLTVAAAEAAIGLAILVSMFRQKSTIEIEDMSNLKG